MKQAGFVPILIIIMVAAAAVGGFLIYQNQTPSTSSGQAKPIPSPQPSPLSTEAPAKAEDPTANWKTYIDDVNNFSLKYPKDWHWEKIDNPRNDPYLRPTGVGELSDFGYPYTRFFKLTDRNDRQLELTIVNENFESFEKSLKVPASMSTDGKKTLKYATGIYILLDQATNKVLWIYTDEYPNEFLDNIISSLNFTK